MGRDSQHDAALRTPGRWLGWRGGSKQHTLHASLSVLFGALWWVFYSVYGRCWCQDVLNAEAEQRGGRFPLGSISLSEWKRQLYPPPPPAAHTRHRRFFFEKLRVAVNLSFFVWFLACSFPFIMSITMVREIQSHVDNIIGSLCLQFGIRPVPHIPPAPFYF